MKISFQWLNDHIDISDFAAKMSELAHKLTSVGFEVEAIENPAEQFKNVVVGQIEKLDRHPNADRLTVCQVNTGEKTLRQIVCGAKNHKAGDKVVVTLPGAVLPGNFEIKKSKIRDVESLGMLASTSELGLSKESEGILILPTDAPIGKDFASYSGLDDVILEVNVTPNRADCLSHLGLARELACLLDRPLKVKTPKMKTSASLSVKKQVSVEVKAPELCSRYCGRAIEGVKVGPSPAWLKRRLESVGLNSINNVVDVTNFVMFDRGQPLHAFDSSTLKGSKIIVDRARPQEKFKTLAQTELTMSGDELTIRDGENAVCVAGAIGGLHSGVSDKTTQIFLESAHFAMDSVRRTARRHGLQTDSSYRFSRGTDPSGVIQALDLAASLIQEVAGGEVSADHWDIEAKAKAQPSVAVDPAYVGQRLGYSVSLSDLENWMKRLGAEVKTQGQSLLVQSPSFRMDLERPEDYVEEYGRLNGYDRIPAHLPQSGAKPLTHAKAYTFYTRLSETARSVGFSQTVNYGFVGEKYQRETLGSVEAYAKAGLKMDSAPVMLKNPISEDLNSMRISLIPGLLRNVVHNFRHGSAQGRLFELGATFSKGKDGFDEGWRLSFVSWGEPEGLWDKKGQDGRVLFDMKGRVQALLSKLQIQSVQWRTWESAAGLVHPGQAATLFVEGRNVGFVASVHPEWLTQQKVRVPVVIAELDVQSLERGQPRVVKYKSISKFPAVERDIALVQPKEVKSQDVTTEIKKAVGALLQSVEVFDVFEGGNLPENHRSVAYRMIFQDFEATLTEERLNAIQAQILSALTQKLTLKVR